MVDEELVFFVERLGRFGNDDSVIRGESLHILFLVLRAVDERIDFAVNLNATHIIVLRQRLRDVVHFLFAQFAMTFNESNVGFHHPRHLLDRINEAEFKVLHRGVKRILRRLTQLVFKQIDGNFSIIAVTHQGTWPNHQLLRRTIVVANAHIGRIQTCPIQLRAYFLDFGRVVALGRINKLIINVFRVGTKLVQHLLCFAAQLLETCRKLAFEIHLEINIVIKSVENLLRRGRQGVAFLARQIEAGEYKRANHIDQHDNHHRNHEGNYLVLFQILTLVFHHSPPYHLRLAKTNFVALKNSAITLKKYNTSRVSTTPRLNEL